MDVVATGVHDARVGGRVVHLVGFRDGKGVHVGAQSHGPGVRLLAVNVGNNARARHMGLVVHPPRGEHGRHVVHGLVLLKGQLGVRMQVPPNAHPFRVMLCRQGLDACKKAHGKRVGLSWVHA